MKEKIKISVIVPIYNAKKTLRRCIKSILSQTYTDFELILINDGSTDSSVNICNEYKYDKRVTLINKKNEGSVKARIDGINLARGEYITFIDADDWIDKNMVAEMYNQIDEDVDLVTIAPHKFYGQLGIGLLIRKENVGLKPQIDGGKSTTIYRAGTPDVAGIVAVSEAIEIALSNLDNRYKYIKNRSEIIKEKLKKYDGVVINNTTNSIPHTINFSLKGLKAQQVAKLFSDHEIYVSAKTSCCPVTTPSKLVYALTHDKSLATSSIRVSLSHLTTMDEVLEFLKVFDIIYKECCSNGKI